MPAEAKPYKEGNTWSMRKQVRGESLYVSGFRTAKEARDAMTARVELFGGSKRGFGAGPFKTTVAEAMLQFACERLPRLKGARQECGRINRYLRLAGLPTLELVYLQEPKVVELTEAEKRFEVLEADNRRAHMHGAPRRASHGANAGTGELSTSTRKSVKLSKTKMYCEVKVRPVDPESEPAIPNSLHVHRAGLAAQSAASDVMRRRLASTPMAQVTRYQVQALMDQIRAERSPATVGQERALLRRLFNYARACWHWEEPKDNPATMLDMPTIDNERKRVMSHEEEARMAEALQDCRDQQKRLALTLLTETAMRTSEPLLYARWKDVDFENCILHLSDSKTHSRDVPLSPRAIEALKELQELSDGSPDSPILKMTYEGLKAAWKRACKRAGIEDLTLYDLRRTGATRVALEFGNIFMVQALTGHTTLQMPMRYVKTGPKDLVKAWKGKMTPDDTNGVSQGDAPPPAMTTAKVNEPAPESMTSATSVAPTLPMSTTASLTVPVKWPVPRWNTPSYDIAYQPAVKATTTMATSSEPSPDLKEPPSKVIAVNFGRRRTS